MLVKYCYTKKEEWVTYLDNCVFTYNTSLYESSGFTPFQLMFNRQAVLPIDIDVRKANRLLLSPYLDVFTYSLVAVSVGTLSQLLATENLF